LLPKPQNPSFYCDKFILKINHLPLAALFYDLRTFCSSPPKYIFSTGLIQKYKNAKNHQTMLK